MLMTAILMAGVGILSAQTSNSTNGTNPPSNSNLTRVTDLNKKDVTVNKSQTTVTSQTNSNPSSTTKVKISKEEWANQSERGRQYILAHPELYIVEEK